LKAKHDTRTLKKTHTLYTVFFLSKTSNEKAKRSETNNEQRATNNYQQTTINENAPACRPLDLRCLQQKHTTI